MTLQPGARKLCSVGNYKFTGRRLGKGNFAKVEEAAHNILNIKVAIKIMDVSTIKEEYVIRNLYREAKIMSRLSHPCIAALYQTMQHGNMYYLVTELVGGGDLCNFIKGQRNGRLEEHYTRVFARQLISAISHMHNLGIVHRDLKMENIMLNLHNDRIKIVDFGLSNIYTGDNPLRTHCGSPEYAAPELFVEGKHYGPEVDLWSLGVILYGMVVGQLPFISSSSKDGAITSHQQRRKRLLEQINKGLSPAHKKSLALLSNEFKAMMAKLLIADSSKRINITELIFHPWVTEKGRKSIRSNPIKKLDEHSQNNIIKDVSTLTNIEQTEVMQAIKSEPNGNVAGIFNILSHAKALTTFQDDPVISKTLNPHYLSPRPKSSKTGEPSYTGTPKSPLKRQVLCKSGATQKVSKFVQSMITPRSDINKPTGLGKFPVDKNLGDNSSKLKIRAKSSKPLHLPSGITPAKLKSTNTTSSEEFKKATCNLNSSLASSSVNVNSNCSKSIDSRPSLSLKNKTNRETAEKIPARTTQIVQFVRSASGDGCDKNTACMTDYNNVLNTMSCPSQNTRSKRAALETAQPSRIPHKRNIRTHSADITSDNLTVKSTPTTAIRRPLTTGPSHTAERAAKRRSMLPVITNKRMPYKNAASTGTDLIPKYPKSVAGKAHITNEHKKVINPVKCYAQHRMNFSNEPIARSIAGYVTKNISNKLDPLVWMRGAKVNIGT